jgi:hypothetical protein
VRREERRALAKKLTFGEITDALLEAKANEWGNKKHREQWRWSLTEGAVALRPRSVDETDTDAVLAVLKPIWTPEPETASRLRGRIEAVLDAQRRKDIVPAKTQPHGEAISRRIFSLYLWRNLTLWKVERAVYKEGLNAYNEKRDNETRYAHLSVVRSTGKAELIESPVRFQGTTSLSRPRADAYLFDKTCRGISLPLNDALSAQMIERRMGEFRKLASRGDPDDPLVRNAKDACFAIGEALGLGYLWAQTEAKPLARSARRQAGAMSGGSKSGAAPAKACCFVGAHRKGHGQGHPRSESDILAR